jgi:hypothetical protein
MSNSALRQNRSRLGCSELCEEFFRKASALVHSERGQFLTEHGHHGDLGWFLDALGFSNLNRAQWAVVEAASGER